MARFRVLVLLAALALARDGVAQDLTLSASDDAWAQAFRRASFVFYGRVLSVRSTSTAAVRPGSRTIVLETTALPDSASRRPPGFRALGARRVTVVMRDTLLPVPGTALCLFTAGLASDSGLAVRELTRAAVPASEFTRLIAKLAAAKRAAEAAELSTILKGARAVWLARVDSVRAVPPASARRSEHDTQLLEAVLRVQRRFAGQPLRDSVVRVLVARLGPSEAFAPSVRPGDVAIFAPYKPDSRIIDNPAFVRAPFVLFLPEQVLPSADSGRVKGVLP